MEAHYFAIIVDKENLVFKVEKVEDGNKQDELSLLPKEVQEVIKDHRGF